MAWGGEVDPHLREVILELGWIVEPRHHQLVVLPSSRCVGELSNLGIPVASLPDLVSTLLAAGVLDRVAVMELRAELITLPDAGLALQLLSVDEDVNVEGGLAPDTSVQNRDLRVGYRVPIDHIPSRRKLGGRNTHFLSPC